MARFSRSLSLVSAVALSTLSAAGGCSKSPPLMLWVDGFAPENVSFDAEDLGRLDDAIHPFERDGRLVEQPRVVAGRRPR